MSDILTIVGMTAIMFFGSEMFDCSLPYYDGESITKGKICQWEKEDFEYVKSIPYTHCEWEDKEEVWFCRFCGWKSWKKWNGCLSCRSSVPLKKWK